MNRKLKVGAIILAAITLAFLLYFKPWLNNDPPPRFVDRLPEVEILGKTELLLLTEEIVPSLYYYQIPLREFISPEFVLSQGKAFGLNVQETVYFFGNESTDLLTDWGVMIQVLDSSKIRKGINRLRNLVPIKDSSAFNYDLYISPETNLAMAYGKDWMLLGARKSIAQYLRKVLSAKFNGISPRWRALVDEPMYDDKPIVAHVSSERLINQGFESMLVSATADSTNVMFYTTLKSKDTLSFSLKPVGRSFASKDFTNRMINAHFNIERLRSNPEDPIYQLLQRTGRRVSFPLNDFLKAWDGDIAFRQGGIQTVMESYIESELDEDFNVTEVVKYKATKVSGFSLYLSMNGYRASFINKLFAKGILTKDGDKTRMLFFPPMKMNSTSTSTTLYTGNQMPSTVMDSTHSALWTFNYTPVEFYLDSTQEKKVFGRVNLSLDKIVRDYIKKE